MTERSDILDMLARLQLSGMRASCCGLRIPRLYRPAVKQSWRKKKKPRGGGFLKGLAQTDVRRKGITPRADGSA